MNLRNILVVILGLLISVSSFATIRTGSTSADVVRVKSPRSAAPDPAPLVMLKNVSNRVLSRLNIYLKRGKLKGNPKVVNSLVNEVVVPHFDLVHMSQSVVGQYWKNASNNTQQQFIKEFTQYVIRTYSSAMQSYDGEKMKFFPIRGDIGDKVRVSSNLVLKNGPPIQLQYGLYQRGGEWVIYDFSVDGVSIVKNYNSQFAGILRKKGLIGLVQELHKRNIDK